MALLENLATAAMTVTAAGLSVIAWMAWYDSRSRKVLLLALGFMLFFLKGLVLSVALFLSQNWGSFLPPSVVLDLAILLLFYGAVMQRTGT